MLGLNYFVKTDDEGKFSFKKVLVVTILTCLDKIKSYENPG